MVEHVYVYIPGFKYQSYGPLMIDKILLDITINDPNCKPVIYPFVKANGEGEPSNVIYRVAPIQGKDGNYLDDDLGTLSSSVAEYKTYASYDPMNIDTDGLIHRVTQGFYDYIEIDSANESNSYQHCLTCSPRGNYTKANDISENYYENNNPALHDGLFTIDLGTSFNVWLTCKFTFYSYISAVDIPNQPVGINDGKAPKTGYYIKVGEFENIYNPASSGLSLGNFAVNKAYTCEQYIDINESKSTWEIPIKCDFPVVKTITNDDGTSVYQELIPDGNYGYSKNGNDYNVDSLEAHLKRDKLPLFAEYDRQMLDWFGSNEQVARSVSYVKGNRYRNSYYMGNAKGYYKENNYTDTVTFIIHKPTDDTTWGMGKWSYYIEREWSKPSVNQIANLSINCGFKNYNLKNWQFLYPANYPNVTISNNIFDSKLISGYCANNLIGAGGSIYNTVCCKPQSAKNSYRILDTIYNNVSEYTLHLNNWISFRDAKVKANSSEISCKITENGLRYIKDKGGILLYIGDNAVQDNVEMNWDCIRDVEEMSKSENKSTLWLNWLQYTKLKNYSPLYEDKIANETANYDYSKAPTALQQYNILWFEFDGKFSYNTSLKNNLNLSIQLLPKLFLTTTTPLDVNGKFKNDPSLSATFTYKPFVSLLPNLFVDYNNSNIKFGNKTGSTLYTLIYEVGKEGEGSNSYPVSRLNENQVAIDDHFIRDADKYRIELNPADGYEEFDMPDGSLKLSNESAIKERKLRKFKKGAVNIGTMDLDMVMTWSSNEFPEGFKQSSKSGYYLVKFEYLVLNDANKIPTSNGELTLSLKDISMRVDVTDDKGTTASYNKYCPCAAAILYIGKSTIQSITVTVTAVPEVIGSNIIALSCTVQLMLGTTYVEKVVNKTPGLYTDPEDLQSTATGSIYCAYEDTEVPILNRKYLHYYAPQGNDVYKRIIGWYKLTEKNTPDSFVKYSTATLGDNAAKLVVVRDSPLKANLDDPRNPFAGIDNPYVEDNKVAGVTNLAKDLLL